MQCSTALAMALQGSQGSQRNKRQADRDCVSGQYCYTEENYTFTTLTNWEKIPVANQPKHRTTVRGVRAPIGDVPTC